MSCIQSFRELNACSSSSHFRYLCLVMTLGYFDHLYQGELLSAAHYFLMRLLLLGTTRKAPMLMLLSCSCSFWGGGGGRGRYFRNSSILNAIEPCLNEYRKTKVITLTNHNKNKTK